MKPKLALPLPILVALTLAPAGAAVRYVNLANPSPAPPYTSWASAATNIQDAIDVAVAGDEIVVTNGVYQTGGRAEVGTITNRVAVDKPLTVRSVNGPEVTLIRGYQPPDTTNGDGAVRCVYLTNGAALVGFTLTNGATPSSGDYERSGGGVLCEAASALVSNCVLIGNSAFEGGGAYGGTLNNCTLTGNLASFGGGAVGGTLNNCTLTGNSANFDGGGAYGGTLNNCTLTGNSARYGGGALGCTLNNCTLSGNSANYGGGACGSRNYMGHGFVRVTLNNCTLTDNSADSVGGGAYVCALNNCIVYYNTSGSEGANYDASSTLDHSCTTPLPGTGTGNLTTEPQLVTASHISAGSPCRGTGSTAYVHGVDIDGEAWANPPSIGCDEFTARASGPLTVTIAAGYSNLATEFTVHFSASISGRPAFIRWEFGDGTVVSNQPVASSHSWNQAGDYAVVLRAYNDSYPAGVSATVTIRVADAMHYVAMTSANPAAPYTSWATAATSIQDAVDAATLPGAMVLVSNGVYQTGGRAMVGTMTNRVAVDKPLIVRSVNGPEVTVIRGYQVPGTTNGDGAVRCVYLTNGAALVGFTLTNGATRRVQDYSNFSTNPEGSGGGVRCESTSAVVSNCVLAGNSAFSRGGGAFGATLNNCALTGNTAGGTNSGGGFIDSYGGGAHASRLNNCTLTGNSARYSGGGTLGPAPKLYCQLRW